MKTIWILWGMWPQASIHFYKMLIQKTQDTHKGEMKNEDYPHLIISNIPVPDLINTLDEKYNTLKMVNNEAKKLEEAWADFLVMPCNTMHIYQKEILDWVTIPFLSIIDCVVQHIKDEKIQKIWVLGTSNTMSSWIYVNLLESHGIRTILPEIDSFRCISQIIKNYISWNISTDDIQNMKKYCDILVQEWAEGIILGCTELPLILENYFWEYNFFASSNILAQYTLTYYQKQLS